MKNKLLVEAQEALKQAQDKVDELIKADETLELTEGSYLFTLSGEIKSDDRWWTNVTVQAGATRQTPELAEIASKNTIERNRLEAWVMEREPEWRDNRYDQLSYVLLINEQGYHISSNISSRYLGAIYMSKETAEWIVARLNDGRIVL